jgi:hypothetical protein
MNNKKNINKKVPLMIRVRNGTEKRNFLESFFSLFLCWLFTSHFFFFFFFLSFFLSFFQWRTQREKRESLDAKFDKIAANSVGSAYAVRSSRSLFFGSNSPFFWAPIPYLSHE